MLKSRFLFGVLAVAALAAACGSTPAATTKPAGAATGTPAGTTGATATTAATPTTATTPAPPAGGGNECAPYPKLNPASPALPSFAPDPQIEAVFPAQIDGSPREKVQSGSWLAFICFYSGQTGLDKLKAQGGVSAVISNLTFGSAHYTIGDNDVTINAFRVAGADGNQVIQNIAAFMAASFGQTPEPFTTSQANIGGKNVTVITDSSGDLTYAYVKGDVVISLADVDPTEAATILAALP